jgi:hypothetical protein
MLILATEARADQCLAMPPDSKPMLDWWICLTKAADIFADQPEPAAVVAEASFSKCTPEKRTYAYALGGPSCGAETDAMADSLNRQLIAHILTHRAETRLKHPPKQRPPRPDYNRM